jgi:hypothetical protein
VRATLSPWERAQQAATTTIAASRGSSASGRVFDLRGREYDRVVSDDSSAAVARLSTLESAHAALCERRRNLHRTIDSLTEATSPEALASLEKYKRSEQSISRERQELYDEIRMLTKALALSEDEGSGVAEMAVADYAELLSTGYYVPKWSSGEPKLNAEEEAWLAVLSKRAATDEIRVTHAWLAERDGTWSLIATIAPPRHDKSYGVPKPLTNPLWRRRFELDYGQRLAKARRRIAAQQGTTTQRGGFRPARRRGSGQ